MEALHSIAVLVLAPLIYFAVGLPWAISTRRLGWAPLWGVGVLGIAAEFASILGADAAVAVVAVALLHLTLGGWLVWRAPDAGAEVRFEFIGFARLYVIALIPMVAAPFAIPGGWGGDWAVALRSGESILRAVPFTSDLLARPPLFGAASIPLLLLGPTMGSFQVFCAVASGGALQLFRSGLKADASPRLVWVLAGSIFFLQVTANAWPKFLCAAFLLAAWQALDAKGSRRVGVAGAMLGFAIATHQSAVLFVPLVLTRLLPPAGSAARKLGEATVVLLVAAALVVPWEIHTILVHGWEAKVQANPAVSQRLAAVPAWLNVILVGVTTFVAWSPLEIMGHWAKAADRFSLLRAGHEIYWLVTETFNALAGSLLGLILPWWIALGSRDFFGRLRGLWRAMGWPGRTALGLALAGQMLLNPFFSSGGSLQSGWVPVGMALTLWFANELADAPAELTRVTLNRIAWWSAGPWLVCNVALTAALVSSRGFRAAFADSDLRLLDQNGWVSLGMGGFPWLQGLLLAGVFWFAREASGSVARPVSSNGSAPV